MEHHSELTVQDKPLRHTTIDDLCINTLRFLAVDSVQQANSGHLGMPMGAASMAYALWTRLLRHDPLKPHWPNRDRFVLSAGHGSMLLYGLLHLSGYDLSLPEFQRSRQWGSKAAGHPEYRLVDGVEATTGPLGQGFAMGVGMAVAEKYLAAHFNRSGHTIVDYNIYSIASDGELMEGISSEAASLAGHYGLDNITYLYDDNHMSIEGPTDLAFTEDSGKRFEAYGWFVQKVSDGNDLKAIEAAIHAAQAEKQRPSIIMIRTHMAYGSPNKQDNHTAHSGALGEAEVKLTKQNLGWPLEPKFLVPEEVVTHFRKAIERGEEAESEWQQELLAYRKAYPELAAEWDRFVSGELPEGWTASLPEFSAADKPMPSREASGKVLNAISPVLPTLLGGSADLAPANKSWVDKEGTFSRENYGGRNFHFGVREHAMGAMLNGMALSGLIPYGATFLVFSVYLRPSLRLAAMMKLHSIFVFSHDSVYVGEDGPTHQPIEHLPSLRAIPDLMLIRPADASETREAWRVAIEHKGGPVALCLSRHALPAIDRTKYGAAEGLAKGAYVLAEKAGQIPKIILLASGSEVALGLEAYRRLAAEGVAARLVSMPCWDLFERQPLSYRNEVLPSRVKTRLAIEAASTFGWECYVGSKGAVIGIDRYGASAPGPVVAEKLGINVGNIVERAQALLSRRQPRMRRKSTESNDSNEIGYLGNERTR